MAKVKTTPPTEKQKEAMSYTKDIAIYLTLTEQPPDNFERVQDFLDILIHRIPDDELDRIIEIFEEVEEEIKETDEW